LGTVAFEVYKDLSLARKLHALGDDSQVECMRQDDDGTGNGTYLGVDNDVVDERLVDLYEVKGELAQVS
jgi:hypothetical protein